ncbi:Hypothetical predicted protein [Paramuricea clavata]|uniref:Uncharacterized protein n=1 Tax=Paramuricea clavata TaxID=317549 RepID=A0A6S7JXE6_PARCT|nr:Hypothetical predicted protein [Paramuricea clavata]
MIGFEISLIKTSVAKDLKLKGKDVVVTLIKVGCQEEELHIKVYRVTVQSLENQSCHTIEAIAIPSDNDEISFVKIDELTTKFGLSRGDIGRGTGDTDPYWRNEKSRKSCGTPFPSRLGDPWCYSNSKPVNNLKPAE